MNPVPFFNTAKPRHGRKRREAVAPAPPLSLVSASYDPDGIDGPSVTLVFSRAINIDDFGASVLHVVDHVTLNEVLEGTVSNLTSPTTLVVGLGSDGPSAGSGVTLSCGEGIKAADDGEPWPGVVDLELPFP